jgi:hypothetical protein
MSTLPPRNRVIYQSEALFVSPDATGYHLYYHPPVPADDPGDNSHFSKLFTGWGPSGGHTPLHMNNYGGFSGEFKNCLISGQGTVDGTDGMIVFDACAGTGWLNPDYKTAESTATKYFDIRNQGIACSGNTAGGLNPILAAAGFTGDFSWVTGSQGGHTNALRLVSGALGPSGIGLNLIANTQRAVGNDGHNTTQSGACDPLKTVVEQIKRVQNANYSFTINRQDVNQFGELGRIDTVVLEAPTVSMDFSYYLTDGENERLLGFNTDGIYQSMSGHMTRSQNEFGNNFFILTIPEGRDAVKGDVLTPENQKTVISLGNGYVTDYSLEASVGSFPTASVTVEGLNIKSDIGSDWKSIPAIDSKDGTQLCSNCFYLPDADSGEGTSVLKPGDITIDLAGAGLLSKQISGRTLGYGAEDRGSAHIQSFTLSTPMGRTALQRLGNTYAFAKEIDFPVTCTLSVNALVSDLKEGNLITLLCGKTYDMQIRMQNPACVLCDPNDADNGILIDFKRATLDSESFSSAIGDNKSVDMTFSTQIGGPEEAGVGVFFKGLENTMGTDSKYKTPPNWSNQKYYKYGAQGTAGYATVPAAGSLANRPYTTGFYSQQDRIGITGFNWAPRRTLG